MQAALHQLELARKKAGPTGSKAKPRWNSNTAKAAEPSEAAANELDLSRIPPIIRGLQTSLQEKTEAVASLQAQLDAMKAEADGAGPLLEAKTAECKVCFGLDGHELPALYQSDDSICNQSRDANDGYDVLRVKQAPGFGVLESLD